MSELGYWVEHFWGRKPIFMIRVNSVHSSTINYTELGMDPPNNYKTGSYLNGDHYIKNWENRKNTFKSKRANIVEIFRFKVNELGLNNYDTVK